MTPVEAWSPIPGTNNLFEASTLGRIRSKNRTIIRADGKPQPIRSRILRPFISKGGYFVAAIKSGEVNMRKGVHQFVSAAFRGKTPAGFELNHINSDKSDNRLANLEWVTRSQNQIHAIRSGNRKVMFTDQQVRDIRTAFNSGESARSIARRIGVSYPTALYTAKGRYYSHVF